MEVEPVFLKTEITILISHLGIALFKSQLQNRRGECVTGEVLT